MVKKLTVKSKKSRPGDIELVIAFSNLVSLLGWSCALLLVIHALLTLLHYQVMELPWLLRELFDVDEEESVPTWFSSSILLLSTTYLAYVSYLKRRSSDPHASSWLCLAYGFLFLSIDEVAGFHEALNSVMDASWAIPGAFLAMILLVVFAKFLRALPGPTGRGFVIAGLVYVGGAVGVELATEPYLYNDELDTLAYNLWTVVEEGMEMGGIIYFLSALNGYVAHNLKPVVHL